MNLGYFPKPDSGIEARAAWAMPSTGFGENVGARWDEMRTPDHASIYDRRKRAFYDEAITKLKEYGLGDFPNPYYMIEPEFQNALNNGLGNPAMVDAARRAAPPGYEPGDQFNFFTLQDAWSRALDQIIIKERKTHPDLPDPTTFDQKIAEESAATRAHAADIGARATFIGKVGGAVGSAAGTMSRDEELTMFALTAPVGVAGYAETLIGRLLWAAASNAILGAGQTGINELAEAKFQQEHFGYSKSGDEVLRDMGYAAAASALLGAGLHGLGEGGAYLLSRWKTGSTGSSFAPDAGPGGGGRDVPNPGPGVESGAGGPTAFGLRAALEQAQELYPALPKEGRDVADVLDSKLQVATTGPAGDLTAHAANVAEAAKAIVNGERPIPIDSPGRNYFESETTSDGHPLETQYEVVEADELMPLTLRQEMNAAAKRAESEWMERIAAGWLPTAKGHNLRAAKGQAAHKVLRAWIKRKAKKDDRWRSEPRLVRPNGKYYQPDVLTPRDYIFELKSTTDGGKIAGEGKRKSYQDELGKKTRIIYYDP